MHIPKQFKQEDKAKIKTLIADYPLAALIFKNANGLEANHIPLQLTQTNDQEWTLIGHIARGNPMWKNVEDKADILVIFQGPQSYITPNWYPTKQEHKKVVPTWNYAAIHIHGALSFIHETQWKIDMLNSLTNQMEADQAKPWQLSDAPEDYVEKQLNAIVGIEISVNQIEGKWKLSQNQPEQNRMGVIQGLSQSERLEAQAMSKVMNQNQDNDV